MLEPFHQPPVHASIPRAAHVHAELWMGGAAALGGHEVHHETVRGHVVIDCAGDLPPQFREHAGLWLPRVFLDVEVVPQNLERLHDAARQAAEALRDERRVYVFCAQGLNRSGLVAGLVLRQLGLGGEEAVALVRAARPGALTNETFAGLVAG